MHDLDGLLQRLDAHGVRDAGEAFGEHGAGHARISYAVGIETLKEAIEIMREATEATR